MRTDDVNNDYEIFWSDQQVSLDLVKNKCLCIRLKVVFLDGDYNFEIVYSTLESVELGSPLTVLEVKLVIWPEVPIRSEDKSVQNFFRLHSYLRY